MIGQLAISYPADYAGKESRARRAELIRAAVARLNPKEVAFVLDVAHTQLLDAMHERDRKVWHDAWTSVLLHMLAQTHDEQCLELARGIVETFLDGLPFRIETAEPMTPEEEAAALRRELLKFGDAGRAAVDRIGKRKGRR